MIISFHLRGVFSLSALSLSTALQIKDKKNSPWHQTTEGRNLLVFTYGVTAYFLKMSLSLLSSFFRFSHPCHILVTSFLLDKQYCEHVFSYLALSWSRVQLFHSPYFLRWPPLILFIGKKTTRPSQKSSSHKSWKEEKKKISPHPPFPSKTHKSTAWGKTEWTWSTHRGGLWGQYVCFNSLHSSSKPLAEPHRPWPSTTM